MIIGVVAVNYLVGVAPMSRITSQDSLDVQDDCAVIFVTVILVEEAAGRQANANYSPKCPLTTHHCHTHPLIVVIERVVCRLKSVYLNSRHSNQYIVLVLLPCKQYIVAV